MATTTNYSWTTPDDTALVKDGASAIRTLGSSVDTTTKALNPSTTLGDIEYRSSTANTNTRLPIGTSGQFLTVSGGVPAWGNVSAGGMTLLSTTSLSGATTTISSISGSYTNLVMFIYGVSNATANGAFRIAPNATTNITYSIVVNDTTLSQVNANYMFVANQNIDRTRTDNVWTLQINDYASTNRKTYISTGGHDFTGFSNHHNWGTVNLSAAITSLVFSNAGGNLSTGTVLLYGVK
jgi:hypothetical protein